MRYPRPGRPILAAIVVVAGLAAAGCDVVIESLNSRATDEWSRSYTLAPTGQIEVVNTNGFIEVTGADTTTVQVRAVRKARGPNEQAAKEFLQRIEIRENSTPDRLRLETIVPQGVGMMRQAEVDYTLTVPAGATVRLRNSNGKVQVAGISGLAKLETTNGGVHAERLSGPVDASTTNGGVRVEVDRVVQDGIRLQTTNGGVQLTMPASARADLLAQCVNGGISVSGLNLESSGESSRRRVEGRLNGGGPRVELETTNGGVRVTGKQAR